jgi:chromosome segregation ATPase
MDEDKIMAGLTKLSSQIADLKDTVTEFRAEVDQRFAQVDQRFAQVDQRFAQVDRRFTDIHDDITVSMARSERAEDKSNSVRTELRHMQTEIAALTRNQRRLTERVDKLDKPDKASD